MSEEDEGESVLDPEIAIRARLVSVAGKARHPDLSLARFVSDPDVLGDDEIEDEDDDRVPTGAREPAMLRRAALAVAALDLTDRCMDDLQFLEFEDGIPDPDYVEETFVYERFPERYRAAYDEAFFRKVLVTVIIVANDLADPAGGAASCIAEEIIRQAVGQEAMEICDEAGLGRPRLDPDEYLQEGTSRSRPGTARPLIPRDHVRHVHDGAARSRPRSDRSDRQTHGRLITRRTMSPLRARSPARRTRA
jgi:hypothetical protein